MLYQTLKGKKKEKRNYEKLVKKHQRPKSPFSVVLLVEGSVILDEIVPNFSKFQTHPGI